MRPHPAIRTGDQLTRGERAADRVAGIIGSWSFLGWQTLLVAIWIGINIAVLTLRWDPYPFILLNLAFSTQAAYATPLIMLASNRQDRIRADLADHDYKTNLEAKSIIDSVHQLTADIHVAVLKPKPAPRAKRPAG